MKSKFYLCALFCAVVGTSVISSCKDTDEDLYLEIKNDLQNEDKKIEALRAELKALIADVEKKIVPCSCGTPEACTCDWSADIKKVEDALQNAIEALKSNDIKALQDQIDALKALKPLDIAGIHIEEVYNPAFGTFALPFGVQSNILMTYYSNKTGDSQLFPVSEMDDEVDGLSDTEFTVLSQEPDFYNLSDPKNVNMNLGSVKLTVNPANTSYVGYTPVLVSDFGGISFSPLKKYDDKLMYGYTRAEKAGLYATEATITDFAAVEKINFDLKSKASEIKNAIKGKGINATALANVIYQTINNVCTRNAVQLTSASDYSVVSNYDLAVIVVNPLGFETIQTIADHPYTQKLKNLLKKSSISGTITKDGETANVNVPVPAKIQRVLNKVAAFVDHFADLAEPALFAESGSDVMLLSMDKANPTMVEAGVKLHATSFSGELLVPFAKKYVAVTKVSGASSDAVARLKANQAENMNQVVNGPSVLNVDLSNAELESGAVYEIAYSVMDYAGTAAISRFYFKVK